MIRTRFAPSPTGYLHIGGVRTALFNWLFARHHGGQFILRIDDTDQQRNILEALAPILSGFRWLGLDWDEGPDVGGPYAPYFQSQRSERYTEVVRDLLDAGAAYYDYATKEELQEERTLAEQQKQPFIYSRKWMAESDSDRRRFISSGRTGVVRLKMPRSGSLVLHDLVRGDVEFAWQQEQDHVIQRDDGSCLYHLATVCDDHDWRISHVIRAEEHLSNTPRQVFIYQSLGYPLPAFAHIPYVAEPGSKTKLSKRKLEKYLKHKDFKSLYELGERVVQATGQHASLDIFNPVIVDFYQQIGFLPHAVLNYLLLLGWSLDDQREEFTREEMIDLFSLERVNKAPASFDPQKLLAFQSRAMQHVPLKQKVAMVLPYLQRAGLVPDPPPCDVGNYLMRIVSAAGERLTFAGAILEFADFFQDTASLSYEMAEFQRTIVAVTGTCDRLAAIREFLAHAPLFDAKGLDQGLRQWLADRQWSMKDINQPLRLSLTGKLIGFGLFETMEILGRDRCLARLDRAIRLAREHAEPDNSHGGQSPRES